MGASTGGGHGVLASRGTLGGNTHEPPRACLQAVDGETSSNLVCLIFLSSLFILYVVHLLSKSI